MYPMAGHDNKGYARIARVVKIVYFFYKIQIEMFQINSQKLLKHYCFIKKYLRKYLFLDNLLKNAMDIQIFKCIPFDKSYT